MNFIEHFNLFGVEAKQIPCIKGVGAPTNTTEGAVGCFYMDTTNGATYKCTAVTNGEYTWEPDDSGTVKSVNGIAPDENGNVEIEVGGGSAEGAVLYTPQTLTEEQKAQARTNIGAAAPGEGGSGSAEGAVLYTEQTLTTEQKAQARANIGAAAPGEGGDGSVDELFKTEFSSNLLDPDTVTLDEALTANGTKYTGTGYLLTDYISVTPGDVLSYQGVLNGSGIATIGNIRFVTAYDNNKNIVASAGSDTNQRSYTVPDGISFVRLSFSQTQYYEQNTIMLHFGASVLPYEPYFETKKLKAGAHNDEHINGLIAEALEDSAESAFEDYTSTNLLNPETMTVGKGMSKNGTEYSGANYVLTDYIPVTSGDVITYQARSKGATVRWFYNMRWVCCFDEKKNILSALGVDANTEAFTVPDGVAYVRVTCTNWTYLLDHAVTKSATIIPYEAYRDVKMLKSESLPKNSRRLALPSTIYCFANQPVSIYFRNVMDYHPGDVYMMVASHTANDGKLYSDHWEYTPTAEGNRRVELKVYDHDYTMKNGELVNLTIKSTSVKSSLTALVIGDSTVNAGKETQKMLDLATADGYSLTLLGTRGTEVNKHEGRPGWTADHYTKSSAYSGLSNPFYNSATSAFDFAYYMAQQGYSGVDCVFLQLGINDMFSAQSDDEMTIALNAYLSNMETIINSIHAYDANIKVVVNLIIPCTADQDAFTGIYNIQTTSWRCKKNTYEANLALLDRYDGVSNVYLSPYNAALDTVNNMDGGVHPVDNGYVQLGTQMYSYMRAIN